jgi:hypothetical protein
VCIELSSASSLASRSDLDSGCETLSSKLSSSSRTLNRHACLISYPEGIASLKAENKEATN